VEFEALTRLVLSLLRTCAWEPSDNASQYRQLDTAKISVQVLVLHGVDYADFSPSTSGWYPPSVKMKTEPLMLYSIQRLYNATPPERKIVGVSLYTISTPRADATPVMVAEHLHDT